MDRRRKSLAKLLLQIRIKKILFIIFTIRCRVHESTKILTKYYTKTEISLEEAGGLGGGTPARPRHFGRSFPVHSSNISDFSMTNI